MMTETYPIEVDFPDIERMRPAIPASPTSLRSIPVRQART
jgi:hypothetical protein